MTDFNQTLFEYIHQFAGRSFILDNLAIFIAEYLPYFMVAAFLVLAIYQNGWRRKFYIFAEGAIAIMISRGLFTEIIRFFYHQERPFSFYNFTPLIAEGGWAFPSGHAAWFFAMALTTWYVNKKWGITLFLLTIVMALARIYVGVHWPFDSVAGAGVGLLAAFLTHWLLRDSRKKLFGN